MVVFVMGKVRAAADTFDFPRVPLEPGSLDDLIRAGAAQNVLGAVVYGCSTAIAREAVPVFMVVPCIIILRFLEIIRLGIRDAPARGGRSRLLFKNLIIQNGRAAVRARSHIRLYRNDAITILAFDKRLEGAPLLADFMEQGTVLCPTAIFSCIFTCFLL